MVRETHHVKPMIANNGITIGNMQIGVKRMDSYRREKEKRDREDWWLEFDGGFWVGRGGGSGKFFF